MATAVHWLKREYDQMKSSSEKMDVVFGKAVILVLTALIAVSVGCHREQSATRPKGERKATWNFWQTVQEPLPGNTLFERVKNYDPANASADDLDGMGLLFEQMAEAFRDKAAQITSAPVAGVDADAANYGMKKAQLMIGYAKALDNAAKAVEHQKELTSAAAWGFGYLFALGRHSEEGDGAWGNALKEAFVEKATTFGNLEVEGQGVERSMRTLGEEQSALQTVEMQTRIALSQRYGREFPSAGAVSAQKKKPKAESL